MAMDIQEFLGHFKHVKTTGANQYICRCPAHDDRKSSLSISHNPIEDKIALHCHAGCNTRDILTEVGLTMRDLMPGDKAEDKPLQPWQVDLVAEYRYTDASGNYLYSKLRYPNKKIRYARITDGKYTAGKGGVDGELYNIRRMQDAINAGRTIFFVEGEKDVETMKEIGLTAVTAGGTGDWKSSFAKYFIGAHDVVIIEDNDKPGRELSEKVKRDLRPIVYKIRTITPSELRHGDVTDWLTEEDGTREKLLDLVDEADPFYAYWISDKGKINPSLLADAILEHNHVIVAHNPGTKSDQIMWYRNGVYHTCSDTEVDAAIDRYIPAYISNPATLRNTRQMIAVRSRFVGYDEINADERYINVRNGLISLPDLNLIPHTPDFISTVQLVCDYDPKAKAPTWDAFKKEYCKDEDGVLDKEMLRLDRMKAGLIISNIYGYRMKGAFVQYSSEGNTGKSVDCEILTYLLGQDNTANVSFQDMSNDRWATGRVWGKRLVVVGDQGRDSIRDSTVFKQLTGGDSISAELKGLQHFMYKFRGVILVSCNHLPVFEDDKGDHMSERLNLIHSRNVIEEGKRDSYLRDKLQREASGILNWALAGLKDYIDNGHRLCKCSSSDALMSEYRCKYDTFYSFVHSECDLTDDRSQYISRKDLEDAYAQYCVDNDLTAVSKRNIKERAAAHGIVLRTLHGRDVYRGIQFKADEYKDAGFIPDQERIPF